MPLFQFIPKYRSWRTFAETTSEIRRFLICNCEGKIFPVHDIRVSGGVELQGKGNPVTGPGGPIWWVEVYLNSLLTPALEGGVWSASRSDRLYPRERPGTHCTGGWVDPGAGLDRCRKSRPTGIRSQDLLSRSEPLYRLRYPGSWSGIIAPLILNLGTRWRWVVSFMLQPLYSQRKKPLYPLNMSLGWARSRFGRFGRGKNYFCRDSNPAQSAPCLVIRLSDMVTVDLRTVFQTFFRSCLRGLFLYEISRLLLQCFSS